MGFSRKVFFATMSTIVLFFSIGGYLLISSLFHSALARETLVALDENKMLRFSYETSLATAIGANNELSEALLNQLSQTILQGVCSQGTGVRVSNSAFTPIYSSLDFSSDSGLLQNIEPNQQVYSIRQVQDRYFIQTACSVNIGTGPALYLESFRDIGVVFSQRADQYGQFQKILLFMLLINGLLIFGLSKWLTLPIQKLSRTTRKIAGGRFDQRAEIESQDEIGMLAVDFNRMADEIEVKISDLEAAAQRQKSFAASFAHELKTPLTSMLGYADLLRSKNLNPEEQFIAANYIYTEGKRLENLSLKLLELIVLQKNDFPRQRISITQIFTEIQTFLQPVYAQKNIQLLVSVKEACLCLEPDLIKTLLFNLLDNAEKALESAGTIQLLGQDDPKGYRISVIDSGPGIAPEDLPQITEAFYMADKSRSRRKGSVGLGLAICREIVQLHQGEISIHSYPDQGTTVHIYLKKEPENNG